MSANGPEDQTPRRMPWEPQEPDAGATPPEPPPDSGWTPPSPTDPTTVWTPAPPTEPPPPLSPGQGGLISSAPVGWSAPPPATAEVAPGLTFADTPSRVVAFIVDVIILSIIVGVLGAIVDPSTTTVTNLNDLMATSDPAWTVLTTVISLAYFVVAWTGGRRATIGQRLFSIQVGNAFDGQALSSEQAIRRALGLGGWISLLGLVPGLFTLTALIGLLWNVILLFTTATSPTKQGIHDRFANSAVVRPAGQGNGLATACLVIVIVIVLLTIVSFIGLVSMGSQMSDILSEIGESI